MAMTAKDKSALDSLKMINIENQNKIAELEIALRNFPYRKSFRELKKFFLPFSHEKVRSDYYKALLDLSMVYNTKGYKYISK